VCVRERQDGVDRKEDRREEEKIKREGGGRERDGGCKRGRQLSPSLPLALPHVRRNNLFKNEKIVPERAMWRLRAALPLLIALAGSSVPWRCIVVAWDVCGEPSGSRKPQGTRA